MQLRSLALFALLALSACGKENPAAAPGEAAVTVLPAGSPSAPLRSDLAPAPVQPASPAQPADPAQGAGPLLAAVAEANQIRRLHGLPEFTVDPVIAAVAQAHADDMLRRHFFEHNTPEGVTPFQRMERAGVQFNAAAENIAMGTSDVKRVFQMWLDSPGHKKNLLNRIYGRHGLGFAGGYWVHDFCN